MTELNAIFGGEYDTDDSTPIDPAEKSYNYLSEHDWNDFPIITRAGKYSSGGLGDFGIYSEPIKYPPAVEKSFKRTGTETGENCTKASIFLTFGVVYTTCCKRWRGGEDEEWIDTKITGVGGFGMIESNLERTQVPVPVKLVRGVPNDNLCGTLWGAYYDGVCSLRTDIVYLCVVSKKSPLFSTRACLYNGMIYIDTKEPIESLLRFYNMSISEDFGIEYEILRR